MRWPLAASWLLAVALAGCDATPEPTADGPLCSPGAIIFCRCEGGDPGTKECLDGARFGPCAPCGPRPTTGPGAQASSSSSSSTGAGVGGAGGAGGAATTSAGGGGSSGTTPLLGPCADDGDCASGRCVDRICTQACAMVSDCPYPQSECVARDGVGTVCAPSCTQAGDCSAYTAPPSACGYTTAIDNWGVTVCADWGAAHALPPLSTDCLPFDHEVCNLGYLGRERVCSEAGVCTQGCYLDMDCPSGASCSSQGSLGNCQ